MAYLLHELTEKVVGHGGFTSGTTVQVRLAGHVGHRGERRCNRHDGIVKPDGAAVYLDGVENLGQK